MFFEGAEKKLEIVTAQNGLRSLGEEFAKALVAPAKASVLGSVHNAKLSAYLLSESGMFVWDDQILMLTCGQTRLIESALFLIGEFGGDNIRSLIYQRKNEFRAEEQHTSFLDDITRLRQHLPGVAMRFGNIHDHHNLLFHLQRPFQPRPDDTTLEMFLYDIGADALKHLARPQLTPKELRSFLGIDHVFAGYQIDDYCFDPYGYSLNAIEDKYYHTLHITPQQGFPYVSLETNRQDDSILRHFLEILSPATLDVTGFNIRLSDLDFCRPYQLRNAYRDKLSIGHCVEFGHYSKDGCRFKKPHIF